MWSDTQLAYLAGIIDGEGCINIYRGGKFPRKDYNVRFYIVSTDKPLIAWLESNFGGMCYTRETKREWKTKYEWVVERNLFDEIAKAVLPYLVIKAPQVKLALKFRSSFNTSLNRSNKGQVLPLSDEVRGFREWCFHEMKRLNHRGSQQEPS